MTTPQQPGPTGPDGTPPTQPYIPPAYQEAPQAFGQPAAPQPPKRGNIFTSKPAIGIGALIIGLILGTGMGGGQDRIRHRRPGTNHHRHGDRDRHYRGHRRGRRHRRAHPRGDGPGDGTAGRSRRRTTSPCRAAGSS